MPLPCLFIVFCHFCHYDMHVAAAHDDDGDEEVHLDTALIIIATVVWSSPWRVWYGTSTLCLMQRHHYAPIWCAWRTICVSIPQLYHYQPWSPPSYYRTRWYGASHRFINGTRGDERNFSYHHLQPLAYVFPTIAGTVNHDAGWFIAWFVMHTCAYQAWWINHVHHVYHMFAWGSSSCDCSLIFQSFCLLSFFLRTFCPSPSFFVADPLTRSA